MDRKDIFDLCDKLFHRSCIDSVSHSIKRVLICLHEDSYPASWQLTIIYSAAESEIVHLLNKQVGYTGDGPTNRLTNQQMDRRIN